MTVEIKVPRIGESVREATVTRWLKKEGERVETGEPVVELETDKVDLEVGAEASGVLESVDVEEGADVEVGDVLGRIGEGEETAPEEATPEKTEEAEEPAREPEEISETDEEESGGGESGDGEPGAGESGAGESGAEESGEHGSGEKEPGAGEPRAEERPITPQARAVAEERGVDPSAAEPRDGRITREGVEEYSDARPEQRVRLGRRRRTIARRLVEGQARTAPVTTFNEADMSALLSLRDRQGQEFEKRHGMRPGVTSFFVKAVVGALKEFPVLNAELRDDEVVLKHYYDIGIAIATDKGLVVPVLRDSDRLSIAEIEITLARLAQQAHRDRLTLDDLRGGTFTITNGGVFGSLFSTPILNPPQVGVLGLHRIEERCVALDGRPEVRPVMILALTYDHRLVDGREAVRFLGRVKELVEDADALFLES